MLTKIFVYGTLMTGFYNHKVIPEGSIASIDDAYIDGMDLYIHPCGSFPCMIPGKGKVIGQLITINEKDFRKAKDRLDALEGYSGKAFIPTNFYNREKIQVNLLNKESNIAWTYIYNSNCHKLGSKIEDGSFRKYIQRKENR